MTHFRQATFTAAAAAALLVLGVLAAAPATCLADQDPSIRPFSVHVPEASSLTFAGASRPRSGPRRRRSRISRRACRSRRCGSSRAIGRRTTTGASARRS